MSLARATDPGPQSELFRPDPPDEIRDGVAFDLLACDSPLPRRCTPAHANHTGNTGVTPGRRLAGLRRSRPAGGWIA